ncbi:hypothetical protein EYZ11_008991 [Aspergillus tanneri]|uniref:Beta-galactosidase n=1 Tax=Aspergillus tanneri TaxID=1220188 RepID=A0A4S3JEJ4_9EURO|nr:hypothetical protein EYZ11_008991 [Aspergillus tanneri]
MRLLSVCAIALLTAQAAGASIKHKLNGFTITEHSDPVQRDLMQKHVTWDEKSLFINGERIMIFSGEVHLFRLPVPSLWIDLFQKIKALGFNTASVYFDWALLEGKPGDYRADGIFSPEPFFDAAKEAGIYIIVRPGPYINAEVSGGGFPGWLQRVNGTLRTPDKAYLEATDKYEIVGRELLVTHITNGGPVILYQPENEYSQACCGVKFPDGEYFQYVIDQARKAGIVVPMISNDAFAGGHNAPGTGIGEVDIYGHDSYPLQFDCFQAGAYDPWGGPGLAACAALVNHEFERVFYKNDLSFGVAILNLYMMFGGTNWGNLGHPGGYTSYDYGSPLTESRNITREKYSELKLIGNFMKSSPSYLLATPGNLTTGVYTDTAAVAVTPLIGDGTGSYFVVRHTDYRSQQSVSYRLRLPTSAGTLTVPQLDGTLTLSGRDSKVHVVDYNVSGINVLYSTAEVFTWKKFGNTKTLLLYGGPEEHHELAVSGRSDVKVIEGPQSGIASKQIGKATVIGWDVSSTRRIVQVGDLRVFLLDRNSAYDYWVPQLPAEGTSPGYSTQKNIASSIIVKAGYIVRTAYLKGSDLHLTADFNATTTVEVIGAPSNAKNLFINGKKTNKSVDKNGIWSTEVKYDAPKIALPTLKDLDWKYLDTLPELQSSYDDSTWPAADLKTKNTYRPLDTPTSLYSSDYGFHTGYLVYRGQFVANGDESEFFIQTQGGSAFGSAVWLNGTHLGSWAGLNKYKDYNATYKMPKLEPGKSYVIIVVVDTMGLDEDWTVGTDEMKNPRGILNYKLSGHDAVDVTWKLTGNLGGEDYVDKTRGPLNEGGLYAERQGYHLPQPPSKGWKSGSPFDGFSKPGIGFYSAAFDLDIPRGWDVPLYFNFANSTAPAYRVQLYVNGYQYGKYISNIGPQTSYPVPEGILNYRGTNWIAVSLWAMESEGAKLDIEMAKTTPVLTGMDEIKAAEQPKYQARGGY